MGRHRRGWLSNLVTAVRRYYGFGVTVPPRFTGTLEAVRGEAAIERPLPRCSSDDWHADPPTVELPVVRRTGAREAVADRRERYWQESPLFMALSEALGMNQLLGVAA